MSLESSSTTQTQRIAKPHKRIGVAVIRNDRGEILIDRRLAGGAFGGLWEFPGGKIEVGETVEACIAREVREELGLDVAVGESLLTLSHTYPALTVTLHVHWCRYQGGTPQLLACEEVQWVLPEHLDGFTFPEANQVIIEAIQSK